MAVYDKPSATEIAIYIVYVHPTTSVNHQCNNCRQHHKTLYSLLTRHQRVGHKKCTDPASHVNYRYLSSSQKDQCLHQLHRVDQQRIIRLRTTLQQSVQKRGASVDEDIHQDLRQIIDKKVKQVNDAYPPGSFARVFWDNQKRELHLSMMLVQ